MLKQKWRCIYENDKKRIGEGKARSQPPVKKNCWVSCRHAFASWTVIFPGHFRTNGGAQLIYFMEKLLAAGKRERVFYIQQTTSPYRYVAGMGESYLDYNRRIARETGVLPFFATTSYGDSVTTSRISYYDTNHQIVESEVGNLYTLMNHLHPTTTETYWITHYKPLELSSGIGIELDKHTNSDYLRIDLHSDIWLPKIMGWMDSDPVDHIPRYDNRELAACHTPRLNRFIANIHALTLEMGAEWICSGGERFSSYNPVLTETGIRLDI